jgi:hypothetical protein
VFLAGFACGVEDFVSLAAGEAFVPEVKGESGEFGELEGEGSGSGCLGAEFSGEMDGVAYDEASAVVTSAEASERAEVVFGIAFSGDSENGLGSKSKGVGYGDPDSFGAYI